MSLGEAIDWALPLLRENADSAMPDVGRITRGSAPVFDPNTGLMVPGAGTVIHEGPCRLRMPAAVESNVMFGEEDVTKTRFVACFPWTVTDARVGDVVTLVESNDPAALTRAYKVVAVSSETYPVLRKLGCEVVEESSP